MSIDTAETWSVPVREALSRYGEPLLRRVSQNLLKPRNEWPIEELIERSVTALTNVAVIDRRLKDVSPASRKLIAMVGLSRQPIWRVGEMLSLLATLDHIDGLTPITALLEAGLVHPVLPEGSLTIKQFEEWLGPAGIPTARVFFHPILSARLRNEDLGLPPIPSRAVAFPPAAPIDGLEWLLRMAIAWQYVGKTGVRLTQQRTLFKRDLQRFQTDALLASPLTDHAVVLPETGLLAVELAIATGLIEAKPEELLGRPAPDLWEQPLVPSLLDTARALFAIESWDPLRGYRIGEPPNEFASVCLAALLLLRTIPDGHSVLAQDIAEYLYTRHPSWAAGLRNKNDAAARWIELLFLGIGTPLRLVEAARDDSEWRFRLGDLGRHLFRDEAAPNLSHEFRQTLVIQPNGELVVFRQGLTPSLIGRLTRFALWRTLGSACTMELTAESVYHGLESGQTLGDIQRLLEQHGTRAIPATVLDSLQRWSSKRERITVYTAATLLEFTSAEDLDAAFQRGLIAAKITDRIGLANSGEEIDYKHFRLIGNRDYEARPQKCITFEPDGVTFSIDTAQSDLLLEAELGRFTEPLSPQPPGKRIRILTPTSLKAGRSQGLTIAELEQWALDRSGEKLASSARLLFGISSGMEGEYSRRLVVVFPDETIADGVLQWPATGKLIEERLGPKMVAIAEANLPALKEILRSVGVELRSVGSSGGPNC